MNDLARCVGAQDQRGTIILCASCKRNRPPTQDPAVWIAPAARQTPIGKRAVMWQCVNKVKDE